MENLNAEQIKKALECCSSSDGVSACESGCPYWGGVYDACTCVDDPNFIIKKALALIKSQEQRIKELTEKVAKWEEECDLRGDMWCKLNEENKRLTEESKKWEQAYDCADSACRELSDKCDRLTEENERLRAENEKAQIGLDIGKATSGV